MMNKQIKQWYRKGKHYNYVLSRITDMRNDICKNAIQHGTINIIKRDLVLKYSKYLQEFNEKYKRRN
jgi:hypothetical protein